MSLTTEQPQESKKGFEFIWHARHGGGLFLGFQYHFAMSVVTDDYEQRFTIRRIRIGFLVFTIELFHHTKPIPFTL